MPLTKLQFDLGIDDEGEKIMRQAYDLLEGHPDLAYSGKELQELALGQSAPAKKSSKFKTALKVLVKIGAVEGRKLGRTEFYAFLQEFDTITWKSTKSKL